MDLPLTKPQTVAQYQDELTKPFPPDFVKWKPSPFPKGKEACKVRVVPYVDARAIMDRLDFVFGADCWQTTFRELTGGAIECTLSVRFPGKNSEPGEWVRKTDVGARSGNMPDADDNLKTGYSDALKRAAVHLGIGRYLYRIGTHQCQWDGHRIVDPPQLPNQFLPDDYRSAGRAYADAVAKLLFTLCAKTKADPTGYLIDFLVRHQYADNIPISNMQRRHVRKLQSQITKGMEEWAASDLPADYPQTGPDLAARVAKHDATLAKSGATEPGDLSAHVATLGYAAGFASDPSTWNDKAQIRKAVEWATEFISRKRQDAAERKAGPKSTPPATRTEKQTSA